MLRSETTGRLVDEFINKTVMLRENMNSKFHRLIVKATVKRNDIWQKEFENK